MKSRGVVLAFMVLLNVALLAVAWRVVTTRRAAEGTRPPGPAAPEPAASVQPAVQGAPVAGSAPTGTARAAFALAEPLAQSWAGDALLLRARGDWPQGSYSPELENWVFVFYSAGQQATAQINVAGGEAQLVTTGAAANSLTPLAAEQWQVDSDAIVTRFVEGAGGELFIDERQDVTMVLTLAMREKAIWTATLIDWETGDVFGRDFDAQSGFLAPEL